MVGRPSKSKAKYVSRKNESIDGIIRSQKCRQAIDDYLAINVLKPTEEMCKHLSTKANVATVHRQTLSDFLGHLKQIKIKNKLSTEEAFRFVAEERVKELIFFSLLYFKQFSNFKCQLREYPCMIVLLYRV